MLCLWQFCAEQGAGLSHLEALGIHQSLPDLPPPAEVRSTLTRGSLLLTPPPPPPPAPQPCTRRARSQAGFVSAASWAPFSWVCSGPFTQVTGTCSLFVSMSLLPTPPHPLRGVQVCVCRAASLSPVSGGSWPGAKKPPSLCLFVPASIPRAFQVSSEDSKYIEKEGLCDLARAAEGQKGEV